MPPPEHLPPQASTRALAAAGGEDFRARIHLALYSCALQEVDSDNSERRSFARRILQGQVNLPSAALAVAAGPARATIAAADPTDPTNGVSDTALAEAMAPGGDFAAGLFGRLARAYTSAPA